MPVKGKPLPLGVTVMKEQVNFSVAVPEGKECALLLYRAGEKKPCASYEMEACIGDVHIYVVFIYHEYFLVNLSLIGFSLKYMNRGLRCGLG